MACLLTHEHFLCDVKGLRQPMEWQKDDKKCKLKQLSCQVDIVNAKHTLMLKNNCCCLTGQVEDQISLPTESKT
jgi:hypothetical protein